jgi:hypothetical protein
MVVLAKFGDGWTGYAKSLVVLMLGFVSVMVQKVEKHGSARALVACPRGVMNRKVLNWGLECRVTATTKAPLGMLMIKKNS